MSLPTRRSLSPLQPRDRVTNVMASCNCRKVPASRHLRGAFRWFGFIAPGGGGAILVTQQCKQRGCRSSELVQSLIEHGAW
jgi:hypothetical protein